MVPFNSNQQQVITLGILCLLTIASQIVSGWHQNQTNSKVRLGVFYESLCPDSRRFFIDQLAPTFKEIGSIIEPELVPFGHARIVGNSKMICQHGPRECDGNRLMDCVQARAANDSQAIETIACLFDVQQMPKDCINRIMPNVSYEDVETCKKSNESFQMMIENEKLTGKLSYVPHITINGEHSEDIQTECEHDLKNYICKIYNGTKPEGCIVAQQQQHNHSPEVDTINWM